MQHISPYKMILRYKRSKFYGIAIMAFIIFCAVSCKSKVSSLEETKSLLENAENTSIDTSTAPVNEKSKTEEYLEPLGLVNILHIDSTIHVDLKYATTDNFTKKRLYTDYKGAYLQPDVAKMLAAAQAHLQAIDSNLSLLVYDAARPLSVQKTMWESVKGTKLSAYVASPDNISLHNYGAAVDITICDKALISLDMGSPFDYFGKLASVALEQELHAQGKITKEQIENRVLLRKVMQEAGFKTISGEWWHFNACGRQQAKERYRLIE